LDGWAFVGRFVCLFSAAVSPDVMLNLQKFKEAYLEPAGKVEVSDKVSDLEPADEPWKTTGKILEFGVKL
jgi:hypothetical protein